MVPLGETDRSKGLRLSGQLGRSTVSGACMEVTVKLSRRKRHIMTRSPERFRDAIEMRKAAFEAEVATGARDARSLIAIPSDLARDSEVRFPRDPFGEPKPW